MQQIQSAVVIYLPDLRSFFASKWAEMIFGKLSSYLLPSKHPQMMGKLETNLGHSGLIIMPHSLKELKNMDQIQKEEQVAKALLLALEYGGEKIALGGQLASQLNYCKDFSNPDLKAHKDKITTGHALTCLAVGTTFETLLHKGLVKKVQDQTLAVVGVGSIGQASLILMLEKVFPRNLKEIILCDLDSKKLKLQKFAQHLKDKYDLKTSIAFYQTASYNTIYNADLFLGASNTPHILDVKKLRPGSIVVDDSFPPIINVRDSIQRMKKEQDVLIVGGGQLTLPVFEFKSLNEWLPSFLINGLIKQLGREGIPGCWLEAVVFAKYQKATQGLVTPEHVLPLWDIKKDLALKPPPFHFYKHTITKEFFEKFNAQKSIA